jgi:hypothetical protein
VFLFSDTQIKDESFMEDINNLLNAGEVPNMFPQVGGWWWWGGGLWRGGGGVVAGRGAGDGVRGAPAVRTGRWCWCKALAVI